MSKTKTLSNKKLASQLIVKVRELNSRMAADQYELCRCLATLHSSQLHVDFGYANFEEFCHHELPFTYGYSLSFIRFITHTKRLKYNKTEAIEIIEHVGISKAKVILANLDAKISISKINKLYSKSSKFSFDITPTDEKLLTKKLLKYGLDVNENGRRMNATSTMLKLIQAA